MGKPFRVGLLVPSSNMVMEVDFYRHLPPPITVHPARMFLEETTPEAERRMVEEDLPRAAELLRTLHPHLVVFGCTSAGSLFGPNFKGEINQRIGGVVGCPVVDIVSPICEELSRLGAKKVAVLTPYVSALNESIRFNLGSLGFKVLSISGLGISVNFQIGSTSPREILEFALKNPPSREAEALLISCTNFRSMEAIPLLKEHFPLPIVTSNQAVIEKIKRIYSREG